MAPSITEIIYYLKFDSLLVGNTIYCNFPPEAKEKKRVGDLINPNFETIKELNPDYVITVSPLQNSLNSKLTKLGFNVITCKQNTFEDIALCMKTIGKLLSDTTGYVQFKEELKSLDSLTPLNISVLFILSENPIYVAGKNTFINEIIERAGGKNAVSFEGYKMVSTEKIYTLNPDVIVLSYQDTDKENISKKLGIRATNAAKKRCLFKVEPDIFTRPGPRIIKAVLKLRELLKNCKEDDNNK